MSYVLPYSIVGTGAGLTLYHITEKPIFFPICWLLAVGLGQIRNLNAAKGGKSNSFFSFGLKAIALYVLGPPIVVGGFLGICAIACK